MNKHIHRLASRASAGFLMIVLCCVGCTSWQGRSYDSSADGPWESSLRQPSRPGQMFGVNKQSREIEQNLGIR